MEKEFCTNGWGKGKRSYPTRAAAEKARKYSHAEVGLRIYPCNACGGWHLTKEENRYKAEPIPSATKLRKLLRHYGRLIEAQRNRLEESERKLAQAEEAQRKAVAAAAEERSFIERETARILKGREPK